MKRYDIGLAGLGVMGQNLALNMENKGFSVAGFDLDPEKNEAAARKFAGKNMTTLGSLAELAESLERPRRILMMVPAGKPVDAVIQDLKPHLQKNDILMDGGNTFFPDTDRRGKDLDALGVRYIGTGVSGGEEGALHGPALMPGGQEEAYRLVEPIFNAIAAKVDGQPCCGYIGKGGAGHYVKMVHNGIEYAIMQLICEAYDILKTALGMSAQEMQKVFAAWNRTDMNSYLLEITAAVLGKVDPETGQPVVDIILDRAGQKGTGKWASQNALDLGIGIPTINAALEGRILSAIKEERVAAAKVLRGPGRKFEGGRQGLIDSLKDALKLATFTSYAQGFSLMREASKEYGYHLNFAEIARIWKGGCIIRARNLDDIRAAFADDSELANLMVSARFAPMVNQLSGCLRAIVQTATEMGIPIFGMCASLGYIDSYRSERLPANLLQAQRDYFGAHKYERVDKPRGQQFHTEWQKAEAEEA
jgi:6-phosphogluconate dehydrogenase